MCGIFGAVALKGTLSYAQSNFIKAATVTGQVRGEDGTGWILQDSSGEVSTFKRALQGTDFLCSQQGSAAAAHLIKSKFVVGHNRKTTSGKNVDSHCHPYAYKNVVGVHNGGIPHNVLTRFDSTKHAIADVDSAKVYAELNAVSDPLVVLEKLYLGAYVLVWLDKRTNELCFARNKERPLWAANGEDGLYFASEPGMLFWLMSRYGLETTDSKLFEISTEHLYKINLDNPTKIARISYTPRAPHYPKSSAGHRNGNARQRADAIWNNTTTPLNSHYFVSTAQDLIKRYPAIAYLGEILQENLEHVKKTYPVKKGVVPNGRRLDVVITNVIQNESNPAFPTIHGYVQDSVKSGITLPVLFASQKEEGFNFVERFAEAGKNNQYFTVRGIMNSIKVFADSTMCVSARLITVWDDEHNVSKTDITELSAEEVEDTLKDRPVGATQAQLKGMWKRMEKPITSH